MISANNNFGHSGGNTQQGEKSNWKIGRIFGKNPTDPSKAAVLEIALYKSQYSIFGTLAVRYEMGRDSKNRIQFETGLNKENPSTLLNPENVASVLQLCDILEKDPSKISQLRYNLDTGRSKLEIQGNETSTIFTVTSDIGSKKIQFDATPAGFTNIHGCISSFKSFLKVIQKKQLTSKLDPEEFGGNDNDEDSPF